MKFKSILLSLSIFAIFAISFDASAKKSVKSKKMFNSEKAKMILAKAKKAMTEMKGFSAKTENVVLGGQRMVSTIYQRNNPDGTIFMRMEMGGAKNPMTFISNDHGYWYIIGDTAIKMAYMTKMQASAMANIGQIPKVQKGTTYYIKNGQIDGIKCFIVTSKLSEEQFKITTKIVIQGLSEDIKKMMKKLGKTIDMTTKIPIISKNYIGKKNLFIYSTEQYNKNGQKLSQMTYSDVKLNIKPSEILFQIPSDMEVEIAKTVMDLSKVMMRNKFSK